MGETEEPNDNAHESLVDRLAAGDPAALRELLAEHRPRIEAMVRRRPALVALSGESVSDLVQSVCAEALSGIRKGFEYRGRPQFLAWLQKVAVTKMIAKGRKKKPST